MTFIVIVIVLLATQSHGNLMQKMYVGADTSQHAVKDTAVAVSTCKAPGGIMAANSMTCTCCPGWHGPSCAERELCHDARCENGGYCNPETGSCVCPDTHTGPHCLISSCSHNGRYNEHTGRCQCRTGYAGTSCEQCASPSTGKSYVCVPSKSAAFDGYMLMQLPTSFADKIISGSIRPDSSISYIGIRPGGVGYNGKQYGCDCIPEDKKRQQRISNAELSLYNLIITECIEDSSLNAQQMEELQSFWYECVSLQEQGLLTNAWYIVAIVFIILFVLCITGFVIYCIVISYNKKREQYEGREDDSQDIESSINAPVRRSKARTRIPSTATAIPSVTDSFAARYVQTSQKLK